MTGRRRGSRQPGIASLSMGREPTRDDTARRGLRAPLRRFLCPASDLTNPVLLVIR
jgi:hypothetical protein